MPYSCRVFHNEVTGILDSVSTLNDCNIACLWVTHRFLNGKREKGLLSDCNMFPAKAYKAI